MFIMHNIENKVRLIPEKILSVEVGLGAKGGGPGNTALTLYKHKSEMHVAGARKCKLS